jgi:hypothetical protein
MSPLKKGDEVEVIGIALEEECEHASRSEDPKAGGSKTHLSKRSAKNGNATLELVLQGFAMERETGLEPATLCLGSRHSPMPL